MNISLRKKDRSYTIYLFIELILILTSLIFMMSIFMDVFSKLKINKKAIDLNYYINIDENNNLEDENYPYYKNIIFKDSLTGKEYDVILISPTFLELKNFNVSEGEMFTKDINENEALIGEEIKQKLGDTIYINGFTKDIEVKVKGILDSSEVLWKSNKIIPAKLENSIVILDRETDYYSSPKIFSKTEKNGFLKISNYLLREIFKKNSSIYISLIFIIVLLIVILNSINLIISFIINKQKTVFGIKYSLGCTKKQMFYSILFEFYMLSILAIGFAISISFIIQSLIPQELGYTFNSYSLLISIIVYIIFTLSILYKQNKKIDEYIVSTLIKRGL